MDGLQDESGITSKDKSTSSGHKLQPRVKIRIATIVDQENAESMKSDLRSRAMPLK